jgi:hypothetical protein
VPNELYSHAIRRLNAFDNVRTVGYVATTWCAKQLSLVLKEIAMYDGWGQQDSSLAMRGVFFDEVPTQYNSGDASYLRTISQAVQDSDGLKDAYVGERTLSVRFLVYRIIPIAPRVNVLYSRTTYWCNCFLRIVWFWPKFRQLSLSKSGSYHITANGTV